MLAAPRRFFARALTTRLGAPAPRGEGAAGLNRWSETDGPKRVARHAARAPPRSDAPSASRRVDPRTLADELAIEFGDSTESEAIVAAETAAPRQRHGFLHAADARAPPPRPDTQAAPRRARSFPEPDARHM